MNFLVNKASNWWRWYLNRPRSGSIVPRYAARRMGSKTWWW